MTRSIQPAQTDDFHAEYDPKVALPYPYHIADSGDVERQELWQGSPSRLLGFQRGKVQRIVLSFDEWMAGDADAAVGLCPVFADAPKPSSSMWADSRPITRVTVS